MASSLRNSFDSQASFSSQNLSSDAPFGLVYYYNNTHSSPASTPRRMHSVRGADKSPSARRAAAQSKSRRGASISSMNSISEKGWWTLSRFNIRGNLEESMEHQLS